MKKNTYLIGCLFILVSCGTANKETEVPLESEDLTADFVQDVDSNLLVADTIQRDIRDYGPEIEKARELAVSILSKAALKADPSKAEFFRKAAMILDSVRLNIPPPGNDLRLCQREKGVLAFVMNMVPNTIHLCSRTVGKRGKKRLAQVLIHEVSHVAGVRNECQATHIETEAMRGGGEGLSFKNGYWRRCQMK